MKFVVFDEGPIYQRAVFAKLQFKNTTCTVAVDFFKKDIPLQACLLTYSFKISMHTNCAPARYDCSGNFILIM